MDAPRKPWVSGAFCFVIGLFVKLAAFESYTTHKKAPDENLGG